MAVIAQEQRFWGLQRWERELAPGTVESLNAIRMRTMPGVTIGESLRVISPDEVAIVYGGALMDLPGRRRSREQISLDRLPSYGEYLIGRRTHYSWRASSPPTR